MGKRIRELDFWEDVTLRDIFADNVPLGIRSKVRHMLELLAELPEDDRAEALDKVLEYLAPHHLN